jgi:hypothetical protein
MKRLTVLSLFVFVFALSNCHADTALSFNGIGDFVSVADNAALSPQASGQMTTSMWVKFNSGAAGVILSKGTDNAWEYGTTLQADSSIFSIIWRPSGSLCTGAQTAPITTNQWHNITTTYKANSFIKLYIDGVFTCQSTYFSPPAGGAGPGNLFFGKEDYSSAPGYYSGLIDEVQIWNYAQTDAQIAQNYNKILQGDEQGLVAYWNFNEGSGQILHDITGHGFNGTLGTSSSIDSSDPVWVNSDVPVITPEPGSMLLLGLGAVLLRKRS